MGKHSSLGPIDPQINGLAAHGIIEEFTNAQKEVTKNQVLGILWQPIIAKYTPTLIGECQKSIKWAETMVTDWLVTGMFKNEPKPGEAAKKVLDELGSHALTLSHTRHISIEKALALGLKVAALESDQQLQEAVLTICRTNRLDGDDKDYGHIVDFKELFGDVQEAIAVYSSDELDTDPGSGGDNNVHLKDWLEEGKKKVEVAREALRYLCEPVALPREMEQFLHYFCGDAANPNALNETEALRVSFYKAVATLVRAFAAIAQDLTEAGYSDADAAALQKEVEFYSEIRSAIKKHSGEELDIKPYEADMRHLLNTYVQADPAADLGELGEMSLTELIIETGIHDAIARKLNEKGKLSKNAIAEGIINNVRKTIIREQLTDPRFYEQMSKLLDDLIKQSRADTAAYEEFSPEGRGAGEAVGREATRRRSACDPARQTRGNGHLQQSASDSQRGTCQGRWDRGASRRRQGGMC